MQQQRFFPLVQQSKLNRILNPQCPECAFYGYVGNEGAVELAITLAKSAFLSCVYSDTGIWCVRKNPKKILLVGSRSCGKTSFARCYAKLVGTNYSSGAFELPYLEVDGTDPAIAKRSNLFNKIAEVCASKKCPLVLMGEKYILPPMVLFIDEIHSKSLTQFREEMLKMLEKKDGIFQVGNSLVDCGNLTIIAATTDPGKLRPAFKSRFIEISLETHNLDNVKKIILINYPNWNENLAMKLARAKTIPREALEIAELISIYSKENQISLEESFDKVTQGPMANALGISPNGLSKRAIDALLVLEKSRPRGLSKKNLCVSLSIEMEEFERYVLPQLLPNELHDAYITISSRHTITEEGTNELRRLGLIPGL